MLWEALLIRSTQDEIHRQIIDSAGSSSRLPARWGKTRCRLVQTSCGAQDSACDWSFHQLDRGREHWRAHCPERQKGSLASLAAHGQQTPIVVATMAGQPDRYRVNDGYQRIAALQQLGRDTVDAMLWPGSELEAVLLEGALRRSRRLTALEEGWLLEDSIDASARAWQS